MKKLNDEQIISYKTMNQEATEKQANVEFEELFSKIHNNYKDISLTDLLNIACEFCNWQKEETLSKVYEWMEDNIYDYLYINRDWNEADYHHEMLDIMKKEV